MFNRNTLSDAKRKEFDAHYKNKDKLPICPTCHTKDQVIPTVRGKPSNDLLLYAQEGHVKLSGCTESYHGWCNNCNAFI